MSSNNLSPEKQFNGLTPAESEALALLAEECGELIQAVGKILRHGIESYHPDSKISNRETLEREIADVSIAVEIVVREGLASYSNTHDHGERKVAKLPKYLHHVEIPAWRLAGT